MPAQRHLTWTDRAFLARSLHRLLSKRLFGMTLAVCILTACGFYLLERLRFTATARDTILFSTTRFQSLVQEDLDAPDLGDHQRLQQTLDNFLTYGQSPQLDLSMGLEIKDTQGRVIASRLNPAYASTAELNDYIKTSRYKIPLGTDGAQHELVFLNAKPFLHVLIPFTNTKGNTVAYGDGLFSIRQSVIHDANKRMALAIFLAVCVVIATTGLLYPVLLRLLRQMHTASLDLMEANLETLSVLGRASAKRDSDVDSHSHRVTIYAVRLGECMGLERQAMRSLIKGAFLHDVGKIGVRDALLLKPGRLTSEEFEEMRLHVQHGRDIVSRAVWLHDALDVIGGHHERHDGTGYDQGLKGQDIPLVARIFAVADVFDALASARPYKPALQFEVVLGMLEKGRGSHFDPAVLDAFLSLSWRMYDEHADRPTEELDTWLRTNCAKYFSSDIEEWLSSLDMKLRQTA